MVIEPDQRLDLTALREVWAHRDLIYFLVRRDVAVRYRQSAIGVLWAVLQPLLLGVVFSVFLGWFAKVPSEDGIPYAVFALSGMVAWLFFANALTRVAESMVASSALVSKVYFPRITIPLAAVISPAIDFVVAFLVVLGSLVVYGITPSPRVLLVPFIIPLILLVALAVGTWLSALNVKYRDVHLLVPFLVQVGMFCTPIVYPFDLVPDAARPFYALNPLVGVLEIYRWLIFPTSSFPDLAVIPPLALSAVFLLAGLRFFLRSERSFADVI